MDFPRNILKYYLSNVYFFCGTACGGKTTISKAFAEKHGFLWAGEDLIYEEFSHVATPEEQPVVFSRPATWEEYFNRPYKEHHEWLQAVQKEQLPMTLLELMRLSTNKPVVADIFMPVQTALSLAEADKIVFLVAEPEMVLRDFWRRHDHMDIYNCIMGLKEPAKSMENVNNGLTYSTWLFLDDLYKSRAYAIKRTNESTVEDTLALVEAFFGFN